MKHKDQALQLLNQMIERAEADDLLHKAEMIKTGKASKSIGSSWMTFHLKRLQEIIKEN